MITGCTLADNNDLVFHCATKAGDSLIEWVLLFGWIAKVGSVGIHVGSRRIFF
jgi:hypothetical protein